MKTSITLVCASFFVASSVSAFNLSDISDRLFADKATGIDGQLKDAAFEFKVDSTLLKNKTLRENTHILVSRNRGSVLIAGQARTQALKDQVQALVLDTANLQWMEGDVNNVEPSNAQVCGKKAAKSAANERRRFNLKTAEECSTVNRFYNEVRLSAPRGEIQQSDDELLRATILNKLLHAEIIDKADTIKIVVSDKHVYLLGDVLAPETAKKASEFVEKMPEVAKVIPLFRF